MLLVFGGVGLSVGHLSVQCVVMCFFFCPWGYLEVIIPGLVIVDNKNRGLLQVP